MNKFCLFVMISTLIVVIANIDKNEFTEIAGLQLKLEDKIWYLNRQGFDLSPAEVDILTGDIVEQEMVKNQLTIAEAAVRWQLSEPVIRYITIKTAAQKVAAPPAINQPPAQPNPAQPVGNLYPERILIPPPAEPVGNLSPDLILIPPSAQPVGNLYPELILIPPPAKQLPSNKQP